MDLKNKIAKALSEFLDDTHIRLEDENGISGFVVSPRFKGMSAVDRQALIDDALRNAAEPLTTEERRQVLMIAGLTPVEFSSVGARIRVHRVKELADGAVEVLLHGGIPDAEYVRGTLKGQKAIQTTEPKQAPGALGALMSFRAKGTKTEPMTKAKAVRVLTSDPCIEVMPNA